MASQRRCVGRKRAQLVENHEECIRRTKQQTSDGQEVVTVTLASRAEIAGQTKVICQCVAAAGYEYVQKIAPREIFEGRTQLRPSCGTTVGCVAIENRRAGS